MNLFDHVLLNVCLNSTIWVQLKLVIFDKLLEYVLRLMYIRVTSNVHQYV